MAGSRFTSLQVLLETILLMGLLSIVAGAQTETTIAILPDGTTTTNPYTLIADGLGNFYGTAIGGNGSIFELSPASGGGWTVTTLYAFPGASGPYEPEGIVMDAAGNLYVGCLNGPRGSYGSIAEFSPNGDGGWTENTIFEFNRTNGATPSGNLVLDSAGNLYGTTQGGGNCSGESGGCGLAYELSPVDGKWKETILHNFAGGSEDGAVPAGGLVFDTKGNLYGTTQIGGLTGCSTTTCGVIFELTPAAKGWKEKVIHRFDSTDGAFPSDAPVVDAAGNLYGTAYMGGAHDDGTVFELSPTSGGEWKMQVVHSFQKFATGVSPVGGVTLDASGNIYVATEDGGVNGKPCAGENSVYGCGSVWEFSAEGTGKWNPHLLYVFTGGSDGSQLNDRNLVLENGNVYGAASYGGDSNGDGTIFEITP
jgi:uncharacterized repeat protein (TIGR03803 family)